MTTFTRQLIPLAPGESRTAFMYVFVELPDGFRLETDDEFRRRILESLTESAREARTIIEEKKS